MSKMQTLIVGNQKVADLRIVHQKRNFALVDIAVLERLVGALSYESIDTIKSRITERIEKCHNIDRLMDVMSDEIAFHRTITGLKEVDIQDLETPEPKENGVASAPH